MEVIQEGSGKRISEDMQCPEGNRNEERAVCVCVCEEKRTESNAKQMQQNFRNFSLNSKLRSNTNNSITQRNGVLPEQLAAPQLSRRIPSILCNPMVHFPPYRSPPQALSRYKEIQSITFPYISLRSTLTQTFHPRLIPSSGLFPFQFPIRTLYAFVFSSMRTI